MASLPIPHRTEVFLIFSLYLLITGRNETQSTLVTGGPAHEFLCLGFLSNFCKSKLFHGAEAEMSCYQELKAQPSLFASPQSKLLFVWLTLAQLVPVPAPTVN